MVTVTLDGQTLAESNETVVVEGNHYFPASSLVESELFTKSNTTSVLLLELCKIHLLMSRAFSSTCPWKGKASYYNLELADGKKVKDIAW